MAIHLTIQGTAADAVAALATRGFHVTDQLTVPDEQWLSSSEVVTVIYVKDECEPGVQRWFIEPPREPPFPPGTLLYTETWSYAV